jgi:hypothetical protein
MQTARAGLRKALRSAAAAYFAANTRYVRPGAIVSIAGAILGLTAVNLSEMRNVYAYPLFVAGLQVVLVVPFRWLIKAPTARGRKFRDDIEGFRRVLDANFRGTGETLATASGGAPPALAAHLPYAIALGIDADRAMILDRRLAWFTGRSGGFSGSDFTASLRKLTPRTVHP